MAHLWDRAASKLSDEDRQLFDAAGLDKQKILQAILTEVQRQSDRCLSKRWKIKGVNGKDVLVRDLCAKTLRWVSRFAQVGDIGANYDPGSAALPWAGFRFLLQLCMNDLDAFESILEGLQAAASVVTRGKIIEYLYLPGTSDIHQQLDVALLQAFAAVLEYLVAARKYYMGSSGKRFAHTTLRLSDLGELVRKIHEQDANVETIRRLLDAQRQKDSLESLAILDGSINRLDQKLDQIQLSQVDLKRFLDDASARTVSNLEALRDDLVQTQKQKILQWLSTIPCHQHHDSMRKDLLYGSGRWLLSSSEYLDWKTSSSSDIIWLHGIPGCGKTRLVTRVIEELQLERGSLSNPAPLAYFYCSRDSAEPERADPCSILRAIVKQLSYVTIGGPIFQRTRELYDQRAAEAALHGLSPKALNAEECSQLILDLASASPLTLVVDAIDECNVTERHALLSVVEHLITHATNVIKIFLSSREEVDIATRFQHGLNLEVTPKRNLNDIERFVDLQVKDAIRQGRLLPGVDPSKFEEKIIHVLQNKSQGMFQWANLQIEALCDRRRKKCLADIMSSLDSAPSTLIESYRMVYQQINALGEFSLWIANTIFRWLLGGQRTLSLEEILAILAFGEDGSNSARDQEISIKTILDCCCTFVVLDKEMGVLRFAHASVREYRIYCPNQGLIANRLDRFLESLEEYESTTVHLSLAERCLKSYILRSATTTDAFSRYASIYWGLHCEKAGKRSKIRHLVIEFLFEKESFHDCLDDMEEALPSLDDASQLSKKLHALASEPVTPLFAISCFGLSEAFEYRGYRAIKDVDLSQLNSRGVSCLYLAARSGHTEVVQTLVDLFIDHEIDLDIAGGQFGSALQAAAFTGHLEIVRILLSKGASQLRAGEFPNALQAAVAGGFEDIAYLLLNAGYKGSGNDNPDAILNLACFGGYVSIIRSLVESKGWIEPIEESPIQEALFNNRRREAQRLVWNAHDINAQEGLFGTALTAAVCGGSLQLVELAVRNGASINQRGRFGFPLRAAALMGHESIVQWLLDRGADCNSKDIELGDCLQAAASKGHHKIVSTLIQRGADVDGHGGYYGSPLQAASFNGHHPVVRVLLFGGAKTSNPGRFRDALQAAAHGNQETVIHMLLEAGARVTTEFEHIRHVYSLAFPPRRGSLPNHLRLLTLELSPQRVGPLEVAAMNGNLSCLRKLLASGATGEYHNCDFSALQIATLRGHQSTVKLLLKNRVPINAISYVLGTALHAAIRVSNLVIASILLDHGAKIDTHWTGSHNDLPYSFGTPLQVASEEGNLTAVEFLCHQGADINDPGGMNGNALRVASDAGRLEVVRYLIEQGANVNFKHHRRRTALAAACRNGHLETAQILLTNGADIDASEDALAELMQCGFDDNHLGNKGGRELTALQIAAACGKVDRVGFLLKHGARVDKHLPEGLGTPLQLAAFCGHNSTVQTLLRSGANIRAKGYVFPVKSQKCLNCKHGYSLYCKHAHDYANILTDPLCSASMQGNSKSAKLILAEDACSFARDGTLLNAIKAAFQSKHLHLAFSLAETGMDSGLSVSEFQALLLSAGTTGHFELASFLMEQKNRETISEKVYEVLQHITLIKAQSLLVPACEIGDLKLVRFYIERGADVNLPDNDVEDLSLCSALQRIDGNFDARDQYGRPLENFRHTLEEVHTSELPLQAASFKLYSHVVALLIDHGAEVNKTDRQGVSSLQASISNANMLNLETMRTLLGAGASLGPLCDHEVSHCPVISRILFTVFASGDVELLGLLEKMDPNLMPDPTSTLYYDGVQRAIDNSHEEMSRYLMNSTFIAHKGAKLCDWLIRRGRYFSSMNEVINIGVVLENALAYDQKVQLIEACSIKDTTIVNLLLRLCLRANPKMLCLPKEDAQLSDSIECKFLYNTNHRSNDLEYAVVDVSRVLGDALRYSIHYSWLIDTATFLIKAGVDVNSADAKGRTPLYFVAKQRYEDASSSVEFLLQHGANVKAQGGEYGSPLQAAAAAGSTRIVTMLLDAGADINMQGGVYGTALAAAAAECWNVAFHKKSRKKWSIDEPNDKPTDDSDHNQPKDPHEDDYTGLIKLLLERGAKPNTDPEALGYYGTALQAAIASCKPEPVRLLIEHGANLDARGGCYGSALAAARFRDVGTGGELSETMKKMERMLLDAGAVNGKWTKAKPKHEDAYLYVRDESPED